MLRATSCVLLSLAIVVAALAEEPPKVTPAPLPAEEAAKRFRTIDGFSVDLIAAEPDVVQPISFCLDERGRIFVLEALNYGQWQATGKDRVVILEDKDGDGRAETRKVFYEGFNYATGIEVGFGGVWVMSPPGLYFIPDRDRDDRPDGPPETIFDGFGYKESRHNLANGFTWGPDGWLYAGHGRTSPSDVGRPGTPAAERIHCDGGVVRIHPTRRVFENFADGTTNPWGVDFDDYGQCFVSNCVNPHLFHVLQGGHYEPWRNRPSSQYAYGRIDTCADHLHYPGKTIRGDIPEVLSMGGGHAHCGTLLYLADQFPSQYRNHVLMCNVHGRRINQDVLERKGSGYVAHHGPDLAISADPWFMGVTLKIDHEGSVIVSDWSDTGECHTYKPQRGTGRIYRVRYGERKHVTIDLATKSDAELVALHAHANDWYVRTARRILQERAAKTGRKSDEVKGALQKQLDSDAPATHRLRALWTLWSIGRIDAATLEALLADPSEYVRAWSIQFLGERNAPSESARAKFAELAEKDPSPVVRLYLAALLQRLPLADRWPIAASLVAHAEDATDPNLPLMIWYGIEPLVPTDRARSLQLLAKSKIPLVRQYIARRAAEGK